MAIQKIKRRKGVIYRVRLLINGRRISRNFVRKIDAINFRQEASLDSRIVAGCQLAFEKAASDWLENHARPRKAPGTVVNNEALIKSDILPCFGKIKLANIEPHHIDAFIAGLKSRMSNASVNSRLELIRAIFNYHIRRRTVTYNPMNAVAFLKVDPKPMHFWTLDEAKRLLEHAKAKYWETKQEAVFILYLLALNTGMRLGEMLALKWSMVDLGSGLITVCRSKCHHTHQVRETTKGRRIRHVPINDAIYGPLKELWGRRNGCEWVLSVEGRMLDNSNLWNRHWQPDIKASGVSPIRIHDMRHTYASHFMMNGGDLFKLQAILGHADMRTTMQYAHFSKAYILENANIVQFSTEKNVIKVDFKKTGSN